MAVNDAAPEECIRRVVGEIQATHSMDYGRALILVVLLLAWGDAGAHHPLDVIYGPPIQITTGGTYSGNWESQDPMLPAVLIDTTEPVVIENCNIKGKSDLIKAFKSPAHIVVRNCSGFGLDPKVAGQQRGNFLFGYRVGSVIAEHNHVQGTSGGVVLWGGTDGWATDGPMLVRYNFFENLDGAQSDGVGGRILTVDNYDGGNHGVIVATYQNMQTVVEISWNEFECEPTLCWMGDTINVYSASGSPSAPIEIHDNFIHGGYPAVPTATHYYSGGITMDGRASDTPATATAFVSIHHNQIVAHANFGIGLAAGHDTEAYANRVVSIGQFEDGNWYQGYVGIWVQNCVCYNQPASVYFNNFARDNVVGFRFEWAYPNSPEVFSPPPVRQDYLLPDCAGGVSGPSSKCTNNLSLPDPMTSADEENEYSIWQEKLSQNQVIVGLETVTRDRRCKCGVSGE